MYRKCIHEVKASKEICLIQDRILHVKLFSKKYNTLFLSFLSCVFNIIQPKTS